MARVILIALCGVCLLLVKSAISLKCRTGIQQADDQFRKIVQVCKRRSTGDNNYSDDSSYSSSSEDDDSSDSSNIDMFDTKFFQSGGNKYSNSQSWKDQNDNRYRGNDRRSGNDRRYSFNYTEENTQYPNHGSNNRYFNGARSSYEQLHNSNSENNKGRKQACIIQCFFNELNAVDQRGFPEQDSVIQLMTHNVHNPELQDFLEEAVIECFHYLGSNMRQDNCYFSQNLLTCLADKGKERCEDWSN